MSRGLCRNYLSFFLAFWYEALGSGAFERHRLLPVLEGEAVKAGTLGPPAGAALTASAFYGASHHCHRTPVRGFLAASFL